MRPHPHFSRLLERFCQPVRRGIQLGISRKTARKNEGAKEGERERARGESFGGKAGTDCLAVILQVEHVGLGVQDSETKVGLELQFCAATSRNIKGDLIVKTGLVSLIWLLSTLDSAGFLDSRHYSPCANDSVRCWVVGSFPGLACSFLLCVRSYPL